MTIPFALAFHAEQLHDDRVWRRVQHYARWMLAQNIKATFFVYPYRARVAGEDISKRVQTLAAWGHEIGQHTHFYAGAQLTKGDKADDLSDHNVVYCLHRDFQELGRMGFSPKSFSAGAWRVNQTVCDTLVDLGFVYDCSAQFPKPTGVLESRDHYWLRSPRIYSNGNGCLLCLPTTCSVGEWFKWGRRVRTEGKLPYQLIYLHDYDLLSLRTRVMFSSFLSLCRSRTVKPVATLVREYEREELP